jgi:hypothetical protein
VSLSKKKCGLSVYYLVLGSWFLVLGSWFEVLVVLLSGFVFRFSSYHTSFIAHSPSAEALG